LIEICGRIGIPADDVPRLNASQGRADYAAYYDPELITKVTKAYDLDLRIFGYRF
jgi:hypothetical protein